jgi:uridine kinase
MESVANPRTFDKIIARIVDLRATVPAGRAVLVAITGIDGCGKGYTSSRLVTGLQNRSLNTALIGIDGWLNLPARRFNRDNPAEHFYLNAFRFDEMFSRLVLPLRDQKSIRLEADLAEETANTYHKYVYEFRDIDVILLEGVYLLKRAFTAYYDFSIWLECTFETALERAIARAQEGLPLGETVKAYHEIYFPAERIHFERADPKGAATIVLANDPRLAG